MVFNWVRKVICVCVYSHLSFTIFVHYLIDKLKLNWRTFSNPQITCLARMNFPALHAICAGFFRCLIGSLRSLRSLRLSWLPWFWFYNTQLKTAVMKLVREWSVFHLSFCLLTVVSSCREKKYVNKSMPQNVSCVSSTSPLLTKGERGHGNSPASRSTSCMIHFPGFCQLSNIFQQQLASKQR